jgi:hypothetical protein
MPSASSASNRGVPSPGRGPRRGWTDAAAGLVVILASAGPAAAADARPWPWRIRLPHQTVVVYRPHVDAGRGSRLGFCAAVTVRRDDADESFGVIWGEARATLDRAAHRATLNGIRLTRGVFPGLRDNGATYLQALRRPLQSARGAVVLDPPETSSIEDRHDHGRGRRPTSRAPALGI